MIAVVLKYIFMTNYLIDELDSTLIFHHSMYYHEAAVCLLESMIVYDK